MIKPEYVKQNEMEVVTIEQLVPETHILRKVDREFKFDFVRTRMEPLYCKDSGRPAIDPVVLFKMLFIGYMFGIRSERQLVKEIEVNVAYRWFLGMNLTDKVPHHSTISQNRRRRFNGTDVFRQLFDDVVLTAYNQGFIEGKTLYTDSTHLKANANKKKFTKEIVSENTRDYLEELETAVNRDRQEHGKQSLPPRDSSKDEPRKEIKVSKTDPESGYMSRDGKPHGFYYLDHRTTDDRYNLITDVFVSPGNIQDSLVYISRLDYQTSHFPFQVEAVGLDAGYHTAAICHGLVERKIFGVVSYRKLGGVKGLLRKRYFTYEKDQDHYICPNGQVLRYRTTNREGFREYVSNPRTCLNCPLLSECTQSRNHQKIITRHVWEDGYEQIKENRKSERGEYIRCRRSETIERSFADAKQLHGYRYARFRGLERVESQSLMTAMVQNIKKIVTLRDKNDKGQNTDPEKRRKSFSVEILHVLKASFQQIPELFQFIFHTQIMVGFMPA